MADTAVPRPARLLGAAGLLPPVGAFAVAASGEFGWPDGLAPALLVVAQLYAALILSFLGGTWWGAVAAARRPDGNAGWLVLSVLPSLWATAALCLAGLTGGFAWTGAMLAAGLVAALLVDRRLQRAGMLPGWWMRLRKPLSISLALLTLANALLFGP